MNAVIEKPVLFSAPLVRAILAGTKTVTRRIVTVPWKGSRRALPYSPWWEQGEADDGREILEAMDEAGDYEAAEEVLGTWQKGQRLWVRESFNWASDNEILPGEAFKRCSERAGYRAQNVVWRAEVDVGHPKWGKAIWRPSIHMPRFAARITLDVVDVRIERLHAITDDDAKSEGVRPFFETFPCFARDQCLTSGERCSDAEYRAGFAVLWDDIHGDVKGRRWTDNPWCWRIAFRRVEADACAA